MKTTLEISRTSIHMALTTLAGAFPAKRPIVITMLEKKLTDFLNKCPDRHFTITVESSNVVPEGE